MNFFKFKEIYLTVIFRKKYWSNISLAALNDQFNLIGYSKRLLDQFIGSHISRMDKHIGSLNRLKKKCIGCPIIVVDKHIGFTNRQTSGQTHYLTPASHL